MQQDLSPYILYAARGFVDSVKKALNLGLVVRKPLPGMLRKLGFPFRELSREEAQKRLDEIVQIKGATVTRLDVIKHIALAFFTPTALLTAFKKRLVFTSGLDTGDSVVLEFLIDIPRLLRPSLSYYLWINIPYSEEGAAGMRGMYQAVRGKSSRPPLTQQEWVDLEPVRRELAQIGIRGVDDDLWQGL